MPILGAHHNEYHEPQIQAVYLRGLCRCATLCEQTARQMLSDVLAPAWPESPGFGLA